VRFGWLLFGILVWGAAAGAQAAANATVKVEALPVYAEMRASGVAVASLKKGDGLVVDFEFKTLGEKWCRVKLVGAARRLGYVKCDGLDRKDEVAAADARRATAGASDATSGGAGEMVAGRANRAQANDLPIAAPALPKSVSGYEAIAADVVREGLIDVTRLGEYDAAARGGAAGVATVRRAALAHYAAGNFELSRNSLDEAVEQYRAALPFEERHTDLLTATLVRLAIVHLHRSEFSSALEYLDRARGVAPNSVAVARLSGWAYYGLDRLEEAVAQWKIAQKIEPDADVAGLLAKAETDLAAESGFRSGQTDHFTLHYEGSATPALAAEILRALEEDYRGLQSELRFAPQEPVAVVLYTQQSFRDITRAPSWAGAWNDGRIRVPVQGVASVGDPLSRILKHELTHSFVRQMTRGRCPQWLHEGLAQWMEGRRTGDSAGLLLEAYERRATPPLKEIEGSWSEFSGTQAGLAYAWSLAAVEYIVGNSGMWGMERLLENLAGGMRIETAMGSALQMDYAGVERGTVDFLRRGLK
jgi:tetratricopeptide (TPR) repeat protein